MADEPFSLAWFCAPFLFCSWICDSVKCRQSAFRTVNKDRCMSRVKMETKPRNFLTLKGGVLLWLCRMQYELQCSLMPQVSSAHIRWPHLHPQRHPWWSSPRQTDTPAEVADLYFYVGFHTRTKKLRARKLKYFFLLFTCSSVDLLDGTLRQNPKKSLIANNVNRKHLITSLPLIVSNVFKF